MIGAFVIAGHSLANVVQSQMCGHLNITESRGAKNYSKLTSFIISAIKSQSYKSVSVVIDY